MKYINPIIKIETFDAEDIVTLLQEAQRGAPCLYIPNCQKEINKPCKISC